MESEYIKIDDLRKKYNNLDTETKSNLLKIFKKIGIDISRPDHKLTGTNIYGFIFQGKVYEAESHKSVFFIIAEIVLKKIPDKQEKIMKIQGRKKKYFSKTPGDFKHSYEKIEGTPFYADTNENAKQLNRRCQRILIEYDIDPSSLSVITD